MLTKNTLIWLIILAVGSSLIVFSFIDKNKNNIQISPSPSISGSPLPSSPVPSASTSDQTGTVQPKPSVSKVPLPTGDSRTTFIDETVPWSLLLADASCELKGEIKFLNHNTYDNQDALFIYKGIDHPARNIFWTVVPQDDISIGPNIFSKISLPDGESLLGLVLPDNPKYKKYELTVKIQYGRQVDEKGNFVVSGGNVKVFEKQCTGKTMVVLP